MRHRGGAYVRGIPAACPLDLALLSSYRVQRARDDGLFLHFGGLGTASLRSGAAALVLAARRARG